MKNKISKYYSILYTFLLLIPMLLSIETASAQKVIKMQKKANVYFIPCKVNGLNLKFIFDTGASNVSISITEALFMLKNGYLNETDLKGVEQYSIANGDIVEGTKINIRLLEIEGLKLYNVEASISHELAAPLLLGQSAISKLGKIQLDPVNNTLTIINAKKSANFVPELTLEEKLEKCLNRVTLNPNQKTFHNELGLIYYDIYKQTNNDDTLTLGIKNFIKAICIDSTYFEPWYNLGIAYYDRAIAKKTELGLYAAYVPFCKTYSGLRQAQLLKPYDQNTNQKISEIKDLYPEPGMHRGVRGGIFVSILKENGFLTKRYLTDTEIGEYQYGCNSFRNLFYTLLPKK
jgi:hypothetical protein